MTGTLDRKVVNASLGAGGAMIVLSGLISLLWQSSGDVGFGVSYLLFVVPQMLLWFGGLTMLPGLIAIGVHAALPKANQP